MFNHGINIIGLWIIVEVIERNYGTRKLSELGGLAGKAPSLAIFFVVLALANIALPLTNAFIGEFMMFNGIFSSSIFRYEIYLTVGAGICIILAAVYTLRMVQKVLYGETSPLVSRVAVIGDLGLNEKFALAIIVLAVIILGVYPQPFLELTQNTTETVLKEADVTPLLR
jgi:NADH-quinone oxidoreductase subunit M